MDELNTDEGTDHMTKQPKEPRPHDYVAQRATMLVKRLHNCILGAVNFSGGWSGKEIVDGILWNGMRSFLIEAKVSRSDFLADAKKGFRLNPETGVGKFRYYACPTGLIKPDELPDRWGLIYVDDAGKCEMPVGFGDWMRVGTHKVRPEGAWNDAIMKWYGTPRQQGDDYRALERSFAFDYNVELERKFLLYLAKRYKQQKFMENLL